MIWLELAWRNLWRNASRSVFASLVACTGSAAVLLALGYMLSAFEAVREGTIRGGLGHLQIAQAPEFGGYSDHPLQHGLEPASVQRIGQVVSGVDGGALLLPRLEFHGVASIGERSLVFLGEGVDPDGERRLSRFDVPIVAGTGLEAAGPVPADPADPVHSHRAVIGETMARLLGVQVGGSITLLAPTVDGGLNAVDVQVVGLVATGVPATDRSRVVVPLALAQRLLRTDKVNRVVVALDDTGDTERLQRLLTPPLSGLAVRTWSELAVFYHQLVDLYLRQFAVLGLIILVVVVLTFSNSVLVSVVERTREIGTLLALGIGRAQLRLQFVLEGLLLGALGGGAGALLAAALSGMVNASGIQMPPPPGQTQGYPLHFSFSTAAALAVVASCMLLGSLSAFLASSRIAAASPLQAMRHG
jgi:putative ABC transport system permease protein